MVLKGMRLGRHTEWRDQHQSLNLGAPALGGQEDGEESTREARSSIWRGTSREQCSSKLSEETVSRMRVWSMVSKVTISTELELSIGFENRRLIWDLDKGFWGEVVGSSRNQRGFERMRGAKWSWIVIQTILFEEFCYKRNWSHGAAGTWKDVGGQESVCCF